MSGQIQVDESKECLLRQEYKTQPWRWYMLATVAFLGFSHGLNWLAFSAVFKYTAEFYQVTPTQTNYIDIVFNVGALIAAPAGMYVLDSLSLREALWIGSSINILGSVIRVVSAYLPRNIPYLGYAIAIIAQFITALAQPYSLYAPPKLASVWFADNERVMANSIASMMGTMGLGASLILGPGIVRSTSDLPTLLLVMLGISFVPMLMTVCGVWMRKPKFPPSPSATGEMKIWSGFKSLIRKRKFWYLCVVWAIQAGAFNAILALMPQVLCPFGYDQLYSGAVGASMIFAGLIGASVFGFIVDRTKLFTEVSKISMCLAVLFSIIIMEIFRIPNQPVLLASAYIMFGIFALIQLPVFIELTIEVTYPVPISTCTGILYIAVQICGAIVLFIAPYLGQDPDPSYRHVSTCQPDNSTIGETIRGVDYINFSYFYVGLSVVTLVVYVLGFTSKYKRLEAEREIRRMEKEGRETEY